MARKKDAPESALKGISIIRNRLNFVEAMCLFMGLFPMIHFIKQYDNKYQTH